VVDGVDDECSCGCLDEAELDLNFDESELNNPPFLLFERETLGEDEFREFELFDN